MSRDHRQQILSHADRHGITRQDDRILLLLASTGPVTVDKLAVASGQSIEHVKRSLRRLSAAGFVDLKVLGLDD